MRALRSYSLSLLSAGLLLAAPLHAGSNNPEPLRIEHDVESAHLTVLFKNRPLLIYAHHATQYKPYIKALFDLTGYNVLLDAPADHLHHHGIMYAVMVNGINYWQERQDTGSERSLGIEGQAAGVDERGRPYARFVDVIEWLDPAGRGTADGERSLLRERRTIGLTVDEQHREVAVQWSSEFLVGNRAESIRLTGDPYNGLGLRLSREFDSRVTHLNSEKMLDRREGDPHISKARWSAATLNLPAHTSTVALFGDPANRLGDPVYFLMYEPFAYLSATQALDQQSLMYRSGERYRLNYLVTVYPEVKSAEFLHKRAQAWERR